MLTFLVKRFVPNYTQTEHPQVRGRYGLLAGIMGIVCNLLLFFGKGLAGLLTGSIAIVADAFNNLSDAGSSIVTLGGFYAASRPADDEHPFGHGRMEYLSGLLVAVLILTVGVELGKSSFLKILQPGEVSFTWLSFGILGASVAVKLFMRHYNRVWGSAIDSPAMLATATDSFSDAVATTGVLLGAVLVKLTGWQLDGYIGLAVAAFILCSGWNAVKDSLSPLLGQSPNPDLVKRIDNMVMSHPEVLGLHDLIIHDYGPGRRMVSLHMEMPCTMDLMAMHDLTDQIEGEIRHKFGCDVTIHMDPVVVDDARIQSLRDSVKQMVQTIDPVLTLHDFRVVDGPTHTNLIFDVVAPHKFHIQDNQLADMIRTEIRAFPGNCFAVVQVEHSLV